MKPSRARLSSTVLIMERISSSLRIRPPERYIGCWSNCDTHTARISPASVCTEGCSPLAADTLATEIIFAAEGTLSPRGRACTAKRHISTERIIQAAVPFIFITVTSLLSRAAEYEGLKCGGRYVKIQP